MRHDIILRVWCEADAVPELEHAGLLEHLMPIGGDPGGPAYEGWTLLSAPAARTQRHRPAALRHLQPGPPLDAPSLADSAPKALQLLEAEQRRRHSGQGFFPRIGGASIAVHHGPRALRLR